MSKGVGVYIGRNEVIAVSAIRTATGPQVESYAIQPISPEDPDEPVFGQEAHKAKKISPEGRAILKALEHIKRPGAFVNVAVSPLQVVTRHFIMPVVPKKDEPSAVRNEASRYVPFKISDSALDYQAHLTHKNVLSVTVTAIRGEVLDTYLEDLRSASAKVLSVEPVYNAVGRAFSALNMVGKTKTHGFVVLQSDGNVNVTFASKGIVYLSRDFLLSGKLEEDKLRFHSELKASMDYFYTLTGGEAIGQIFADMQAGVTAPDKISWTEDRRRAISLALDGAKAGDCLLIAGKGHESYQEFADTVIPFDDRQVVRELIGIKALKT